MRRLRDVGPVTWLGAAVLVLSALVYLAGEQYAGRICIEEGVGRLVPEQRLIREPEGYSAGIPTADVCRIEHGQDIYAEVGLDRWDFAEGSLVLLTMGILLCAGGRWRSRRGRA